MNKNTSKRSLSRYMETGEHGELACWVKVVLLSIDTTNAALVTRFASIGLMSCAL